MLALPTIVGVRDYRIFVLSEGAQVSSHDGLEALKGVDVFCAGDRQFNDAKPSSPQVMHQVEIYNLKGPSTVVVEALSGQCPFTGPRASGHYSTQVENTEVPSQDQVNFSFYTEAEIASRYGAVIFNGHAPGITLAAPAPAVDLRVMARTAIALTPTGTSSHPLTYFDDFDSGEQPVFVSNLPTFGDRNSNGEHCIRPHATAFSRTYNHEHVDFVSDRGQFQVTLADRWQDVFSTNFFMPRQAVELSDSDYLRVHFTVNSDASQRRYWWMFLCGAGSAGQTVGSDGKLKGNIVQTSFFYQPDGKNPSVEGWNCLQVFPRDGSPFNLPPDNKRTQSDVCGSW